MLKSILIVCLSIFVFSCGSAEVEEVVEAKYSLVMEQTGEKIESDNSNYSGNGVKMVFGIGENGELYIYDLYNEMNGAEMSSFEGKTYPGMVMFNDAKFEGQVLIEKIEEEKDASNSDHGKNYKLKGTFTADKGNKVKFSVGLFKMN